MAQILRIHPVDPQPRLIARAVAVIRSGGIVVYPTDSCYALGCQIGHGAAMSKIRKLRQLDDNHGLTLMCQDLSQLSFYAAIDNTTYRLMRRLTPGPYTFLLKATREAPRLLKHPKKKLIGIRVPNHPVASALLEQLSEPMLSTTLRLPGEEEPLSDEDEIIQRLDKSVDLILASGACGLIPTSVLDMVEGIPTVVRTGCGDLSFLLD
jgi:tRNA threonylcarbamoyl adenosine modification protein (Sua5/YciO/YrdC/YwlC family)